MQRKDPVKTIFDNAECQDFISEQIKNFTAVFGQKELARGFQPLEGEWAKLASDKLESMQMVHASAKCPDFKFDELIANDPTVAKDLAIGITGFKLNALSWGVHSNSAIAATTLQVQGTRLIAIANPHNVMRSEDAGKDVDRSTG